MHATAFAALALRHWIGIAVVALALAWLAAAIALRLASGRSKAAPKRPARPPRADEGDDGVGGTGTGRALGHRGICE